MGAAFSAFLADHGYNILGTAFTWLAYNRDSYADNVAMRQNQLYQRRNYHLSWVSVARDDIRDIMQTSVAKINNYMIVTTLVLGFAASMAWDVDVTDSPHHLQVLFYMSVTTSMIYMTISLVFGVISANAAFTYSVELLSRKVRPDATDAYDEEFDYMKQTQQFEKSIWQLFRIPIMKPLYNRYVNGQEPKLEHLEVGGELSKVRNRHWRTTEDQKKSPMQNDQNSKSSKTWYFESFNKYAMLWKPYEIGSFSALRFGGLHLAYVATYLCLSLVVVRSDKRLLGSTLAGLWIVALALAFTATYPQIREQLKVHFAPNLEGSTTKDIEYYHDLGNNSLYLMLVATFLPPTLVLLLDIFKTPMGKIGGPLIFASHCVGALFHICRAGGQQISFGDAFETQETEEQNRSPGDRHRLYGCLSDQSTDRSDSMTPDSHGFSRLLTNNSSVVNMARSSSIGEAESVPNLEEHRRNSELHGKIHDDVNFDMSADRLALQSGKSEDNKDDDTVFKTAEVLKKLKESINHTFRVVKYGLLSVHILIAVGWFAFFLEAIFFPHGDDDEPPTQDKARRDVPTPKLVTNAMDVRVEWPSEFFQPTVMACAREEVFIADEFHVYRMQQGKLSALPCDLSEAIVDISAACNTQSCWPVVLTASNPAMLVNCLAGESCLMHPDDNSSCSTWAARGECAKNPVYMRSHCQVSCRLCDDVAVQHKALTLSQTTRAEYVSVSAQDSSLTGSVYAVRGGKPPKLVEYRFAEQRPILEPWWSVADVEVTGLRAVDVANHRLFFFSQSPSGGEPPAGRVESRMLKRNSAASHVWVLPKEFPPLIAGCVPHLSEASAVHPSGASALVLLGSQDGGEQPPRLVSIHLPY